jgi:DNA polymerase III alpha subunit
MNSEGFGSKKEIKRIAELVWEKMISFSSYAFPRGHATPYGIIAYTTQYLKVHYPVEFFCCHLDQAADNEYNEIKNVAKNTYHVKFMMPDINKSKANFIIYDNKIVWSLCSIKGIGVKAAAEITSKQPFISFEDFMDRINRRVINIKVLKALITSNVFREFGKRNEIFKKLYSNSKVNGTFEKKSKTEYDMEAGLLMPYSKKTIRELYPDSMNKVIDRNKFHELDTGQRVVVAGFVDRVKEIKTSRGKMLLMSISDSGERFPIVCWSDFCKKNKEKILKLEGGKPVKVSGFKNLSNRDEEQIALGNEDKCYIKILQ